MKKIIYLSFLFIFLGILQSKAQDKIYKKDGTVLEAKVTEVGSSEIKYKAFANLNGPVYTIAKAAILKITYENGNVENYDATSKNIEESQRRAQNIYVELAGQGLVFTANYDTRFSNKRNGLGGRIGIGAIGGGGDNLVTIPVSLNYLLGEGKNFFEIGLGATYANASFLDSNGSTVFGTMSFMYRLQPIKSGFSFRGGFTPIFNADAFIPYYAGISLGYTF
nr:hypothetical protein [Pseudopedobacter sp.]